MANPRKLSLHAIRSICMHIAEGKSVPKSLVACGWKSRAAFYNFICDHPKAKEIYRTARELRAEMWAEELIDIADDGSNDTYTVVDKDGKDREMVNHDHIKRSALRIDTRKWVISKHLPKTYGDKLGLEHSGHTTATNTNLNVDVPASELTDAQLEQIIKAAKPNG